MANRRFFFVPVVAALLMGGTANISVLQAQENPFMQTVKPGEQAKPVEQPAEPAVEERREPAQPRVGRETRETIQRPERPRPTAPAEKGFPFGTVAIWLVLAALVIALVKLWRRPWYTHDELSEIVHDVVDPAVTNASAATRGLIANLAKAADVSMEVVDPEGARAERIVELQKRIKQFETEQQQATAAKNFARAGEIEQELTELRRELEELQPPAEPRPEAQTRRAGPAGPILGAMLACVIGVSALNAAPAIRSCDPDYTTPGINRSVTCTGAELGAVTGVAFGGSLSASNFTKPAANKIAFDLGVPAATAPGGYLMELVTSSGQVPSGFTFVVWDRSQAAFLFELDKRFARKGEAGSDPVARQRLTVLERRTLDQGAQIERLGATVNGIKATIDQAKAALEGLGPRLSAEVADAAAKARNEANAYTDNRVDGIRKDVTAVSGRLDEQSVKLNETREGLTTAQGNIETLRGDLQSTQDAFGYKKLRQEYERAYKARRKAAEAARRQQQ